MIGYFKNKSVFITGHTGFKGAWLWQGLHRWGAQLTGYALAPESPALFEQIKGEALGHSIVGDLRNREHLQTALLQAQPDVVFHLAAQPLVLRGYQEPLYTYETNVLGTAHLLEAVRQLDKPCVVVVVTTDKVYDNREWVYPYREIDPLGGHDPYSASKACAELLTASYRSSFFAPDQYEHHGKALATARAGNVIGGGDWAQYRILPDLVRAYAQDQALPLRYPQAIRPWQHVLEALAGYLRLAYCLGQDPRRYAQAYNFGPLYDEAITVKQLLEWAMQAWGRDCRLLLPDEVQAHEAHYLRLDASKAVQDLAWRPRWTTQQAVQQSMQWYKAVQQETHQAAAITAQQWDDYFKPSSFYV